MVLMGKIVSVQKNKFFGWVEDIFSFSLFIVMNCNQRQFNGEIAIKWWRKHFFGY